MYTICAYVGASAHVRTFRSSDACGSLGRQTIVLQDCMLPMGRHIQQARVEGVHETFFRISAANMLCGALPMFAAASGAQCTTR